MHIFFDSYYVIKNWNKNIKNLQLYKRMELLLYLEKLADFLLSCYIGIIIS